jgi:hypothetical protein
LDNADPALDLKDKEEKIARKQEFATDFNEATTKRKAVPTKKTEPLTARAGIGG